MQRLVRSILCCLLVRGHLNAQAHAAAWAFRNIENGGHAAYIGGVAEAGGKRSPAALGIACTTSHYANSTQMYATVAYWLRIPRGLVGFPTDALNCEGDERVTITHAYI